MNEEAMAHWGLSRQKKTYIVVSTVLQLTKESKEFAEGTLTAVETTADTIMWGKFSQKHDYKYMAKWWCLLAMEKLHVSACGGHHQVLTPFLL